MNAVGDTPGHGQPSRAGPEGMNGVQPLTAQQQADGGNGNNGNSTFFLDDVLGAGRDSERQQIEGTLLSFLN